MSLSLRLAGSLFIGAISFWAATAAAQTYSVVDLATLAQGNAAVVRGPNGAGAGVGGGHLVGQGGATGPRRGLLFEGGTAQFISGLAGSDDTVVFGLNEAGGLVGTSNTETAVRGFVGTKQGATRELPPLAGDTASAAYGLNNVGQAVGFSSGDSGERAVMWDPVGTPWALPGVTGMTSSRATGVNERGDVSGVIGTADGPRPVVWPRAQAPLELLLLPGHVAGEASGVNARGDVVGYSADASGKRRATLWPMDGGVVDLGTLPDGDFSQAFGNDSAGNIVGTSTSHEGPRAVIWANSGPPQDLNRLIPPSPFVLANAVGLNNAGRIIATGHVPPPATAPTGEPHSHDETHELPLRVFLLTRSGGPQ